MLIYTHARAHDLPVSGLIYGSWQPTTFLLNEIRIVDFVEKLEESITRADIMNEWRPSPRGLCSLTRKKDSSPPREF